MSIYKNQKYDNASWTCSIHCSDIFMALAAHFSHAELYIDNYSTLKKKKKRLFWSGVGHATQCYLRSKSSCYLCVFFLPFQLSRGAFCSPVEGQEVHKVSLVRTHDDLFNHPSMLRSDCATRIAQRF